MLFQITDPENFADNFRRMSVPSFNEYENRGQGTTTRNPSTSILYDRLSSAQTLSDLVDTINVRGMSHGHVPVILRLHIDPSHLRPPGLTPIPYPDHHRLAQDFYSGDHVLMRGRALVDVGSATLVEGMPFQPDYDTDYFWIGKLGWTQQTYPFYTDWVKNYCEGTGGIFGSVPDTPIFFGQSNVNISWGVTARYQGYATPFPSFSPIYDLSYFILLRHLYYHGVVTEEYAVPEEFVDHEMTEQRFTELRDQYRRELLALTDLKAPRAISLYRSYLSIYGIDPAKYPVWTILDSGGRTIEHPFSLRRLHAQWTAPNIRHPEYYPSHFPRVTLGAKLFANNYWRLTPFKAPYTENNARAEVAESARVVKRITVASFQLPNRYVRPLVDANTAALTALLREREDEDDPPLLVNTPNFDLNYAVPLVPQGGIQDEETGEWDNDLSEESPSFVHAVM